MTAKWTRDAAEFKARVALEALRGEPTTAQLAAKHGIHQMIVGGRKRQAMECMVAMFSRQSARHPLAFRGMQLLTKAV